MKLLKNKLFPFGEFKALTLWPFIFVRDGKTFTDLDYRHEAVHGLLQLETLLVGFPVAYGLSWLKELIHCAFDKERGLIKDPKYRKRKYFHRVEHSIIFEREAYATLNDENYLKNRKFWAWLKF